jgi:hypothetical protein
MVALAPPTLLLERCIVEWVFADHKRTCVRRYSTSAALVAHESQVDRLPSDTVIAGQAVIALSAFDAILNGSTTDRGAVRICKCSRAV